ncbi:hypothetical protein FEM33_18275 [Dyadobacter flavalbus]|uniref:Uncharacterized protein n=1 Tax=Dyadobacter flavalbus TaxID=2579942 RepID=A0A5M8QX79_9BACT|nr:DUF5682 family protein [Dyadobacter flavalbus]KAA6438612.1 hypothetical protein FEM33_18275 [Dyadobacter flavalbus]
MSLHLLGIRHHGPGSSRHVLNALHAIRPDIILIEGPPEGENMLPWVMHADMKPPVALLAYVPDNPDQAVFYPFAAFSPEWNAVRYALQHKIPVRFIDMPLAHSLAKAQQPEIQIVPALESSEENQVPDHADILTIRKNPIAYLAEIAGFEDAEEWWEHKFEIADHPSEVFSAIASAMEALRKDLPQNKNDEEAVREAFMRKAIRTAQKEMYTNIAVICGAWHVPALSNMPKQKEDDVLLKNLPKVKVETTWIPWTNDRLSFASWYGAGLESPGWYHHAWHHPEDNGALWLSHAARVFRDHQMDISSAHIIESVRLANALAGLRQLQRPGLKEFNESILAVMCMGDPIFMKLVHQELIVGKELGQIPEGTPQVPVQRDLEQLIKKLRLKISPDEKNIKLDLRDENDLQKSILFHRLIVLNVDWAGLQHSSGKGTFREEWRLLWYPELTIKLLEKAPWGNTIEEAANKYLEHEARSCTRLDEITVLVQKALPSDLQNAAASAMKRMDELAASTADTTVLMNAFVPLVRISRYGNVRKTDLDAVNLILKAIFYRISAGLPLSCTGIDEEQAAVITEKIKDVNQSVLLLDDEELKTAWIETIRKMTALTHAAPKVQGYCCKTLYDAHVLDNEAMSAEFSKALSINNNPDFSAAWLEGFLNDAATVLILDDNIWNIVNKWLLGLEEAVFLQIIPLLRRTFSIYSNVEKRKIAQRVNQVKAETGHIPTQTEIDEERAKQVLPLLEKLMGV